MDEPFRVRDSQFNYPHIRILSGSTVKIVVEFSFIIRILSLGSRPFPRAVKLRHAFEKNTKLLIINKNDQKRPAVALTFMQHHRKATAGLGSAHEAIYLKVRWKALFHSGQSVQASAARRPAL